MIGNHWFGPASRTIPTTDLYFLNACSSALGKGLRRMGANSFSGAESIVICRRDDERVVQGLIDQGRKRLFYVIDDDLWAAGADTTLPADYRGRLMQLREGQHARLIERAETIVTSSPILADVYRARGHEVAELAPYWSQPLANGKHFSTLKSDAPLELGYLGTASHAADRAFALQVFERLIARDVNIRMTIVGAADVPDGLRKNPRLRILKPLPWPRHKRRLAKLRFHILLYPTEPTRFNMARSCNKLIEHAVSGGIGIYSRGWQFAQFVSENRAGLVLDHDPGAWAEEIEESAGRFDQDWIDAIAAKIAILNAASRAGQSQFWSRELNLKI